MDWIDIASIVFVCVTMNHLGLIGKVEEVTGKSIPILNCPKCSTFWATLMYLLWKMDGIFGDFPLILAISFLSSYIAIWLELFEGFIDTLFLKLYGKIYNTSDNAITSDSNGGNQAGSMP